MHPPIREQPGKGPSGIWLKLMIESGLLSIKTFLVKVPLKIGQEKYLIDSVLRTNPWRYEIKDLNDEKIIGRSYERELLLCKS